MNLSNEQIKKILDEAPDGATDWCINIGGAYDDVYGFCGEDYRGDVFVEDKWSQIPLSDLRKQLESEAEWVNGDALYHTHHAYKSNPKLTYVGKHPFITSKSYCISEMDGIITVDDCYLSTVKPETEAEKIDRERVEAAYDLHKSAQHAIESFEYDGFELFKKRKTQVKAWLAIVDKTNYRKEVE